MYISCDFPVVPIIIWATADFWIYCVVQQSNTFLCCRRIYLSFPTFNSVTSQFIHDIVSSCHILWVDWIEIYSGWESHYLTYKVWSIFSFQKQLKMTTSWSDRLQKYADLPANMDGVAMKKYRREAHHRCVFVRLQLGKSAAEVLNMHQSYTQSHRSPSLFLSSRLPLQGPHVQQSYNNVCFLWRIIYATVQQNLKI